MTMDGTNRVGPYRVLEVLGRDAAGVLCLGEHEDGTIVDVRVLPLVLARDDRAVAELEALADAVTRIDHPHLRRLLAFGRDEERDEIVYLASAHRGRVTLQQLIDDHGDALPESRVVTWAAQLADAIDFLHGRGIAHGAIEPAWIVIDEDDVASLAPPQVVAALHGGRRGPPMMETDLDDLTKTLDAALGATGDEIRRALAAPTPATRSSSPSRRAATPWVAASAAMLLLGAAVLWPRPGVTVDQETPNDADLAATPPAEVVAVADAEVVVPAITPVAPAEVDLSDVGVALRERLAAMPPTPGCMLLPLRNDAAVLIEIGQRAHDAGRIDDAVRTWQSARHVLETIDAQRFAAADAELARQRFELRLAGEPAGLSDARRDALVAARAEAELARHYRHAFSFVAAGGSWRDADTRVADVFRDHRDALRAATEAQASWTTLRSEAPPVWIDDPTVVAHRRAALAAAERAQADTADGRFADACVALAEAEGEFLLAIDRQDAAVAARVNAVLGHATAGRLGDADAGVGALEPFLDARELRGRIDATLADQATSGRLVTDTIGQTLAYFEPAEFEMGGLPAPLTHGYWLGCHEVTRRQFAAFVADSGYVTDAEREGWCYALSPDGRWRQITGVSWRNPGFSQDDDHPVVAVSARDAEAFCLWRTAVTGRTYRLPTEAEWELGCATHSTAGPFNAADASWSSRFAAVDAYDWDDRHVFTAPVGSFAAEDAAVHDMRGNVQEWCRDVFVPFDSDVVVEATPDAPRVLRGGSFAASPEHCRCAHRDGVAPDARFVSLGFRVVMETP